MSVLGWLACAHTGSKIKGKEMIEKLEIQEIEQPTGSEYTIIERVPASNEQMHDKINELVDAVNELQLNVSKMENLEHLKKIGQGFKNLNDPYARQRDWIGKLCRFRDKDYKDDQWDYGLLQAVEKAETAHIWKTGRFKHNLGHWYDYCEPVKSIDSIIYKGGNNE